MWLSRWKKFRTLIFLCDFQEQLLYFWESIEFQGLFLIVNIKEQSLFTLKERLNYCFKFVVNLLFKTNGWIGYFGFYFS